MGLIELVVVLVILGLLLYVVETYVPISPPIKVIIRVVVVLVIVLWLLRLFVGDVAIPRLRGATLVGAQGAELTGNGFLIGWSVTSAKKTVCYGPSVSSRDRTIACP